MNYRRSSPGAAEISNGSTVKMGVMWKPHYDSNLAWTMKPIEVSWTADNSGGFDFSSFLLTGAAFAAAGTFIAGVVYCIVA